MHERRGNQVRFCMQQRVIGAPRKMEEATERVFSRVLEGGKRLSKSSPKLCCFLKNTTPFRAPGKDLYTTAGGVTSDARG